MLLAGPAAAQTCDVVWRDAARARDLPVRIRLPGGEGRVPVVLFSPGLGGSIGGGGVWGQAWAERGLAVVHLEHPGSDAAVYRAPGTPAERRARVRAAASAEQLAARVADAGFVLDRLAAGGRAGGCDLGRLDLGRVGFAGHSMGAWTAQALAGQRFVSVTGAGAWRHATDERIKAAIALSPSALTTTPAASFGAITIPFLSVTGTEDGVPMVTAAPAQRGSAVPAQRETGLRAAALAQRTGPFEGMAGPGKYLIVFKDGGHMVFAGNPRREAAGTDAHIEAVTIAATTAFWGATLLGDGRDRAWLDGDDGLARRLAVGDRYERK